MGDDTAWKKAKSLFGTSLIQMIRGKELTGTLAADFSGNSRNGTYVNSPTLNSVVAPGGGKSPTFDGTNDYINAYSASMAAALPTTGGTWLVWFNASLASLTDGVIRDAIRFQSDTSRIQVEKTAANNVITFVYKAAGAVLARDLYNMQTGWHLACISWDTASDKLFYGLDGEPYGAEVGSIGTFGGTLNPLISNIGGGATDPLYLWAGSVCEEKILNRKITTAEFKRIFNWERSSAPTRISFLGDSITAATTTWSYYVSNGKIGVALNHAASSQSIITNMDAQTVAAASDNADIIIIALGFNDNNAGDMAELQAKYEENIIELKASNPGATIYSMNVLPCWTDVGGGTEVDKSNIRTAISAACTAQGITCWDTYTVPWIISTDTSDGTHPTVGGASKIAAEVLARLP